MNKYHVLRQFNNYTPGAVMSEADAADQIERGNMPDLIRNRFVEVVGQEEPAETRVKSNANADATDAARELADEHGLQLWSVKGTGKNGRILLSDVQKLVTD